MMRFMRKPLIPSMSSRIVASPDEIVERDVKQVGKRNKPIVIRL